ncbi:MAG TPA: LacI family transcriptional regulator [bacterium]|nr:LacI family transcriptional regulator [bacterium]
MKVTIYDLAKKAGVSISTASKALNDRKDVGEDTKRKIRELAGKMNYEPSHSARSLAMKKTENIGVVTARYYSSPMLTNPFYSRIIEGIEEQLINSELNLVTGVVKGTQVEAMQIPKMAREKSVDGIITLGYFPEKYVELIVSRGLHVVSIDNYTNAGKVSSVIVNDEEGGYIAVNYLINEGHRRIAFISGTSKRKSFMLRGEGYRRALEGAGIAFDEKLTVYNEQEEPGYGWMKDFIGKIGVPDAVFCSNDVTAILAINTFRDMGLTVPDDVSVVGFDNIELTSHFIPSITTVDVDKEKMGAQSVSMLLNLMAKKEKPGEKVVFPANLVIRDSVRKKIKA